MDERGSRLERVLAARRTRPADRWSRVFGQIVLHSFLVLLGTGVLLALWYDPDTAQFRYDGSYAPLRGVPVSGAYASVLDLSFEIPGGLLLRQIHHWATLVFIAAICLKLLRVFLIGAFRRPHGLSWLLLVTLLPLAMVAGVSGSILPDDMLSGGSLSLIQGITQSIPLVGTRLTFLLFGGEFPGTAIIPRLYWLHVAVLPAAVIGVLVLLRRLNHRHEARPARVRATGAGRLTRLHPLRPLLAPDPAALGFFFATCGILAVLGAVAQINPIWQLGPFRPGDITSGAVPGWYMGFLDGAVRLMPDWEFVLAGQTLTLAVLVPALLVPGAFFTVLAAYPLIERRFTGDLSRHQLPDRPRDAAMRTAVGAAGVTFYGLLWAAAANDQFAHRFQLSLFAVTWFFRVAVLAGPPLVFVLTRWICIGLVERERHAAEHGRETGRIVRGPDGGFSEITEPVAGADRAARRPAGLTG
jgi:ubiquinol-cytochrome c reductase cytochrome b subunit